MDGDDHKGVPSPADSGILRNNTFTGMPTRVIPERGVVISPPLKRSGWLVGNGCCATITAHRGATLAINGTIHVPERFAIDFAQLDAKDRLFSRSIDHDFFT